MIPPSQLYAGFQAASVRENNPSFARRSPWVSHLQGLISVAFTRFEVRA